MSIKLEPLRYHTQKVLPTVYDDSLSYYETLCKITKALSDLQNRKTVLTDVTQFGVSVNNEAVTNSNALNALIDKASSFGGTLYFPPGTFKFGATAANYSGDRCIKLKSNVSIIGSGPDTILQPTGTSSDGLDMFHFNDLIDIESNPANYLENCIFADFVVDGVNQSTKNYTSAGKAFMVNLMRNCHWIRVMSRNIDATGFGMDCPIMCSMHDCVAENCGKAATNTSPGGAGIGIGFGFAENAESILITGCECHDNKTFGLFFEHQRRFSTFGHLYKATATLGLISDNNIAYNNYNNFGCIQGLGVQFTNCISHKAKNHGYLLQNSEQCRISTCYSNSETATSYVIYANNSDGAIVNNDNVISNNISKYSDAGAKVVRTSGTASMARNVIKNNVFSAEKTTALQTSGSQTSLFIMGNVDTTNAGTQIGGSITTLVNKYNSWN